MAHEALGFQSSIGILMPCNILIIDNENQTSRIVFHNAKSLLKITNDKRIIELADKIDILLELAFDSIS